MRRIILLASLSLPLLGGGVAMADRYAPHQVERTSARPVERREVRRVEVRHLDRDRRPAPRTERFEHRHGFRWIGGEWTWNGYEWIWMPGHYVRAWR